MEATPKEGCPHPAENRACDGLYQAFLTAAGTSCRGTDGNFEKCGAAARGSQAAVCRDAPKVFPGEESRERTIDEM